MFRRQPAGLGRRDAAGRLHRRRQELTASARTARRRARCAHLGVACVLAESINGLFFRNCVNFGLLALECPGIVGRPSRNCRPPRCRSPISRCATARPARSCRPSRCPENLLAMMQDGGIFPVLEKQRADRAGEFISVTRHPEVRPGHLGRGPRRATARLLRQHGRPSFEARHSASKTRVNTLMARTSG